MPPPRKLLWLMSALAACVAILGLGAAAEAQTVISTISGFKGANAVGVNPTTNRVYVANAGEDTVSVIDSSTNTVIGASIPVGSIPFGVAVNPTTNRVYITNELGNRFEYTVSVIDGSTNKVIGAPIVVGAIQSGTSHLSRVAVNPTTNRVYVTSTGTDTVVVIDGKANKVIGAPIHVGTQPFGVAVNSTTNRVYVTNSGANTVSVIDGDTNTVIGSQIPVGNIPIDVAVNPTTNRVYVANADSNTVSVIDGTTNTVVGTPVPVGTQPTGVAANPTTNRVYVGNAVTDTVSVIDGSTNTVIGEAIAVGVHPQAVAVNPTTNRVYVANSSDNSVSVIDANTNPANAMPPTAAGAVAPSGPIINDPLTDPSLSTSWPVVQQFPLDALPSGLGTSSYRTDGFHIAIDHKSADSSVGDAKSTTSEYLLPNEHLDAPLQAAGAGANQSIEVDAQQVAGGLDNQYGVACRMTSAGGYVLFAGSGGRAGIWKMRGVGLGVYTTPGLLEGFLADVQLDPDTVAKGYHLRADCNGTRLVLFVNGKKVAEAQDGDFKSGHVGLYAYTNDVSGVDVGFTNLSISAAAAVASSGEARASPSSPMDSSEQVTLNGVGSILDVARFPLNGGNYSVSWTGTGPGGNSGDSDFIVDLIGVDGSYPERSITNTVLGSGETQSSATSVSNVPAGQYYVRVSADGVWTVTISKQ